MYDIMKGELNINHGYHHLPPLPYTPYISPNFRANDSPASPWLFFSVPTTKGIINVNPISLASSLSTNFPSPTSTIRKVFRPCNPNGAWKITINPSSVSMNADVVTIWLVNGPMGTATVTRRYSTEGLPGSEAEISLHSLEIQEFSGAGITSFPVRRGWRPWKVGRSWRRDIADFLFVVAGKGVSVDIVVMELRTEGVSRREMRDRVNSYKTWRYCQSLAIF